MSLSFFFFYVLFLFCFYSGMPRSVPGVADFCGLLLLGLAVFFTAAFLAGDGPSPLAASLPSVAALVALAAARFLVVLAAGATTVFDLGFAAAFDFGAAAALGFVRPSRAIIIKTGCVLTII